MAKPISENDTFRQSIAELRQHRRETKEGEELAMIYERQLQEFKAKHNQEMALLTAKLKAESKEPEHEPAGTKEAALIGAGKDQETFHGRTCCPRTRPFPSKKTLERRRRRVRAAQACKGGAEGRTAH